MAWITPKTDWIVEDGVDFNDLNRMEGNTAFIATNPSGNNLQLAPDGGNVGIGITSPTSKLHLDGGLSFKGATDVDRNIEFASDADLLWDESEDEFYLNKSLKVDGGIESDGVKLKTKVIEIGTWDMDSGVQVQVTHGLTLSSIRNCTGVVANDNDTRRYTIGNMPSTSVNTGVWVYSIESSYVVLDSGNPLVGADWNGAQNRGHLIITYEV